MEDKKYYIGVDVGTQSVRAAVVTNKGKVLATASSKIQTWNPYPNFYEQSSDEIWNSCCCVVKEVTKDIECSLIQGIGFDATCSLVALDRKFKPLSVSKTGQQSQNVILWMDHRATKQADYITNIGHPALTYVGLKISPEMEPPKLLWLKENLPDQWNKAGYFFDLPDFLTWKATGSLERSLCSLVCKWMYQSDASSHKWDSNFWKRIGLEDLAADNFAKIGNVVKSPGKPCGSGLSQTAAMEMNLSPGTPVGVSIIDAHAGGIGLLGCSANIGGTSGDSEICLSSRMALICGTSTCHMVVNQSPIFTAGVWGPYFSAMIPGMWLSEAGQSAAGVLIDHIINSHPAINTLKNEIANDSHIQEFLNKELDNLFKQQKLSSVSRLTADLHVWPDYHGNRSPLADPSLKGMISGLTLTSDKENLAKLYLAAIQALAYNTRHIIDNLEKNGHTIRCLLFCGGLAKNSLYVQMHSDITGLPAILPNEKESVLLGAAILGATAAGHFSSVTVAMESMCGSGRVIKPQEKDISYHEKKYQAFLELLRCQRKMQDVMGACID